MEALRSIQESLVFRQSRMDNFNNNDLVILTEILLLCHRWDQKYNDH